MISLIRFSLIHATINIPAFAVYVEPDMNAELIAHRWVAWPLSFCIMSSIISLFHE